MDEPVEETSLPDEHLAQLLCSSELLRHQLIVENAALKRRMKPSKAETERPVAPPSVTITYLSKCHKNALGLPVVNPEDFVQFCNENDVAAVLTVGRHVPENYSQPDMRALLSTGEYISEEGPLQGGGAEVLTDRQVTVIEAPHDMFIRIRNKVYKSNISYRQVNRGILSSWRRGQYTPVLHRNIFHPRGSTFFWMGMFSPVIAQVCVCLARRTMHGVRRFFQKHINAYTPAVFWLGSTYPVITQMPVDPSAPCESDLPEVGWQRLRGLLTRDGLPRLGVLLHVDPCYYDTDPRVWAGALRDHVTLRHAAARVITCDLQGRVLAQNAMSRTSLGVLGKDDYLDLPGDTLPELKHEYEDLNYLLELFGSQAAVDSAVKDVAEKGVYRGRHPVTSSILRALMRAETDSKIYHDVLLCQYQDGVTKQQVYLICEVDVSEAVAAEELIHTVQKHQHQLLETILPQEVIDVLLDTHGSSGKDAKPAAAGTTQGLFQRLSQQLSHTNSQGRLSQSPSGRLVGPGSRLSTEANGPFHRLSLTQGGEAAAVPGSSMTALGENESFLIETSETDVPLLSSSDVGRLATFHPQVTILFADILNFKSLCQSFDAADMMLFLNDVFSAIDDLLEVHDVYKVETIADVYMVACGLFDRTEQPADKQDTSGPAPKQNANKLGGGGDPDHAKKILRFAKSMVCAVGCLRDPIGEPVQLRVGIHSGPIMTGVVGRRMPRFCCFGDTVNTASRMLTSGHADTIHASAAFRDLTPDEPWEPTGGVTVKGKGNMETYTTRHIHGKDCARDLTRYAHLRLTM